jgi:hypothetical protein
MDAAAIKKTVNDLDRESDELKKDDGLANSISTTSILNLGFLAERESQTGRVAQIFQSH